MAPMTNRASRTCRYAPTGLRHSDSSRGGQDRRLHRDTAAAVAHSRRLARHRSRWQDHQGARLRIRESGTKSVGNKRYCLRNRVEHQAVHRHCNHDACRGGQGPSRRPNYKIFCGGTGSLARNHNPAPAQPHIRHSKSCRGSALA